jgi:hypothetical protein
MLFKFLHNRSAKKHEGKLKQELKEYN